MTVSQGGEQMEPSVEQRLTFLQARVKTLEGLLAVAAAPAPAPLQLPRRRRSGRRRDRPLHQAAA